MPIRQPDKFLIIVAACIGLAVSGCAGTGGFREGRDGMSSAYLGGVPHVARGGKRLNAFDPVQSFFPIILFNAVVTDRLGGTPDFAAIRQAGFNTVAAASDQPAADFVTEAARNGLQAIIAKPTDDDLTRHARSPAILAWLLDSEPSIKGREAESARRAEAYRERRLALRSRDPDRPALVVDVPLSEAGDRSAWARWRREADISAIMLYPFRQGPIATLGEPGGPAVGMNQAVQAQGGDAPVWAMLQGFAHPLRGWYLPSPEAARLSMYSALIEGASGVIWFSQDNYFSRNLGILGVGPEPKVEYGVIGPRAGAIAPLRVRAEQIEESQKLWAEISRLNREATELAPALLSPTSKTKYQVTVGGTSGAPIRTLVKEENGNLLLLSVNLGNAPVDVAFTFDEEFVSVGRVFSGEPAPGGTKTGWTDRFEPFAVRIYRMKRATQP